MTSIQSQMPTKVKLNIKGSKATPVISQFIDMTAIQKVVAYDDITDTNVSTIKKHTGSKIKINIKPKFNEIINHVSDDDDDAEDVPYQIVHKKTQTLIKINVTSKNDNETYKSAILEQIPTPKMPSEKITLPNIIHIESLYEDGIEYFIDQDSKYIFPPNAYGLDIAPEPIGKLHETSWNYDDCEGDKFPLVKRKIEWFFQYDLDVDNIK